MKSADGLIVTKMMRQALNDLGVKTREKHDVGKVEKCYYENVVALEANHKGAMIVRWSDDRGSNVELRGQLAELLYKFVRREWPEHACARMDVAANLLITYDDVLAKLVDVAKSCRVQSRPCALPYALPTDCRSHYFGSSTSGVVVNTILYEKGRKNISASIPDDPNRIRLEVRIRPHKSEQKHFLAKLDPKKAWGWSPFTQKARHAFDGNLIERVKLPQQQKVSANFSMYIGQKYWRPLSRLSEGDLRDFGKNLRPYFSAAQKADKEDRARRERARRAAKRHAKSDAASPR